MLWLLGFFPCSLTPRQPHLHPRERQGDVKEKEKSLREGGDAQEGRGMERERERETLKVMRLDKEKQGKR